MHNANRRLLPAALFATTVVLLSCREAQNEQKSTENAAPGPKTAELIFPASLQVADESVNAFVRAALAQCARGDYNAFRALWTAKQDPVSREEFEEGWHAVSRVEVRALKKAMVAATEPDSPHQVVYVLLTNVALDPARKAGKREPKREVVLMLVPEQGDWRFALAPKPMREWIKEQAEQADATGAELSTDDAATKKTP